MALPPTAETAPQPPTGPTAPATPRRPPRPPGRRRPRPPLTTPGLPGAAADTADESKTAPQVFYGEDGLPDKVKAMRKRILDATRTGDLEALRPVIESNEDAAGLLGRRHR